MNKLLLLNFVKDRIISILLFLLNDFLLFLFYFWTSGQHTELLYPMEISFSLIIVYITIEWIKYQRFNANIQKCKRSVLHDLEAVTCEQKEISEAFNHIYENYMKQLSDIQSEQRMKNNFFMQWAHNLKSPISTIKLILCDIGVESVNEIDLNLLKNENNRIYDSLQNLLTFIRLDDFSKDYIPHAVKLSQCLNNAVKARKSQFIYNNIVPEIMTDNCDLLVLTDEKWNEFIIEQIISNGIKYSAVEGQVKRITFMVELQGEFAVLKIIDEGVGIPSYDIGKVFEPFFTGENGRKCYDSSGIGLYICSVIAKKLGHTISIKSDVGKGTEVCIKYLIGNFYQCKYVM